MDILVSETSLELLSGLIFVIAAWAGFPPWIRWSIRTEVFLKIVLDQIRTGDIDRAVVMLKIAPNSPVAKIILAFIEEGRYAAERRRDEFEKLCAFQQMKLGVASLVVGLGTGLTVYLGVSEVWPVPLLVSSVVGAILVVQGWSSTKRVSRDSEYVLSTWLNELAKATPPELRHKIRGLN